MLTRRGWVVAIIAAALFAIGINVLLHDWTWYGGFDSLP